MIDGQKGEEMKERIEELRLGWQFVLFLDTTGVEAWLAAVVYRNLQWYLKTKQTKTKQNFSTSMYFICGGGHIPYPDGTCHEYGTTSTEVE